MEEEIIEIMDRCYKGKLIIIPPKIINKILRKKIIKKIYINSNRYERVYILLKYKPKINYYGEIVWGIMNKKYMT